MSDNRNTGIWNHRVSNSITLPHVRSQRLPHCVCCRRQVIVVVGVEIIAAALV